MKLCVLLSLFSLSFAQPPYPKGWCWDRDPANSFLQFPNPHDPPFAPWCRTPPESKGKRGKDWWKDYPIYYRDYPFDPFRRGGCLKRLAFSSGSSDDDHHPCVITQNGALYCWGANENCQTGTFPNPSVVSLYLSVLNPRKVNGVSDIVTASVGAYHTCALDAFGKVFCWGLNNAGELGVTAVALTTNLCVPTQIDVMGSANLTAVAAGDSFTCVASCDGTAWCFGAGTLGQLGSGSANSPTPVVVPGVMDVVGLSAGSEHCCAWTAEGTGYCWGDNTDGQLGNGGTSPATGPFLLPLTNIIGIGAFYTHTCAWTCDGNAYCWGASDSGQQATPSTTPIVTPTLLPIPHVLKVVGGAGFTCVLTGEAKLWCFGLNDNGEVGIGVADSPIPTPQLTLEDVADVSAGKNGVCAIKLDGKLTCWGYNAAGDVGLGLELGANMRAAPRQVPLYNFNADCSAKSKGKKLKEWTVGNATRNIKKGAMFAGGVVAFVAVMGLALRRRNGRKYKIDVSPTPTV